MSATNTLTIFVPASGSQLRKGAIRRGSGIVASEVGDTGRFRVDYEGDADLFPTYGARVRRAAERHLWTGPDGKRGYPTQACAYVSRDELLAVGSYNPDERQVDITDRDALGQWLGGVSVDEDELTVK